MTSQEFIKIKGGEFEFNGEQVRVDDFEIGKYPVTNWNYFEYYQRTPNSKVPFHWEKDPFVCVPEGKENHPVVNVSWHAAMAYCKWLGKRLGKNVTLPTEAQWEYAAGGPEKRTYPWGETNPNDRESILNFNNNIGDTTPVNEYPNGQTPQGVYGMSGNVWEWCAEHQEDNLCVLRGGAFDNGPNDVRVAARGWLSPGLRDYNLGFRVVVSPSHSLDDETMNDDDFINSIQKMIDFAKYRIKQNEKANDIDRAKIEVLEKVKTLYEDK